MVGPGNARVRVTASVNFDRVERTTQTVDPSKQALTTETKAEIIPGAQGGAASNNTANSYENTKSTETYAGAVGGVRRLTVAVLVNDRRLPAANGADTVARFAPRTAAELANIESLVRSAVGADSARGDVITVVSQSFAVLPVVNPVDETEAPVGMMTRVQQLQRPLLSALGILAVVIVGFITLRALGSASGAAAQLKAPSIPSSNLLPAPVASTPAPAVIVAPPRPQARIEFSQADTQVRDKVLSTVQQNPDAAVRLVKSWIKEG
jgi:flagellar M-ring protein FliF